LQRELCVEPPHIQAINYSDITSPVMEDSAGKGQPSGSHKDHLAMHVTTPAGPASALPTSSHFRDMTNASTRLLIAPKMPQQCHRESKAKAKAKERKESGTSERIQTEE